MTLETTVNGLPVTVEYVFWPGCDMRVTGSGFGDADPDEPDEVEIQDVLTPSGQSVFYYLHDSDVERIERECIQARTENVAASMNEQPRNVA